MAAVLDPSVLVSPDYQVQMQQAERQRALAQALQQQAMQDTPGNGGSVSWTQGAARLAEALASTIANKRAMKTQLGASQAYAKGMASMFGLPQTASPSQAPSPAPQMPQGAPPAPGGPPMPQQAPQAPQSPPFVPGQAPAPGQADPLAPQPDAPPQAAPPQPAAAPMPPQGGAPSSMGPMNLTGDPRRDMGLYVMNPEEYGKAMIGNAAKGTAPTDIEIMMSHAGIDPTSTLGRQIMQQSLAKQNYIPPTTGRPGGWTIYPDGHKEFNPQAPIPGAVPGPPDADGNATWRVPAGTEAAVAARAKSQAAGEAGGKAPYQFQQVFNPETGQMEYRPVSEMVGNGGGSLNSHYGVGGAPPAQAQGHFAAGPTLGASSAADAYGKGNAQAFLDTQGIAKESPQRVQALREMQSLISGPGAMSTGPTAARMQQLAEQHGLPFGYSSNAFVFNKDAARFVAQSASDLGLNGSDARLGMMAHASPNMTMTPEALKVVMPTMIGLEYAKMAKATAASSWAQRDPGGNAKFETTWRQSYDPRMFTAYAQGGAQALAHAPANLRQQWLKDYRNLKGMGVDFTQFAQ